MKKDVIIIIVSIIVVLIIYNIALNLNKKVNYSSSDIPEYQGIPFVTLNNNIPEFSLEEDYSKSFEIYSNLDYLGRAGVAYANIGTDLMPKEKRSSISKIKPSGWHSIKYDIIKGKYLYNRCHLIGYQLSGENANEKNLITCTRQMNVDVMVEYENMVADYVKSTKKNVLYRVTPVYKENNLVASGVKMEACSISDKCKSIKFNVFIYNVQDGIKINYLNGESELLT